MTMILCCMILGLQQVAIKLSAQDIAPVMQLSLRSLLGLGLVLIVMGVQRQMHFDKRQIGLGVFVGALFALEFLFLGEALRHTTATRSVVFLYTSPLFSALFLHFFNKDERLGAQGWLGLGLAFFGIMVAFLSNSAQAGSLMGDGLALLAGLSWGLTTVIIRLTPLGNLPAKHMLAYQLLMVFVILLSYALLTHQTTITINTASVLSVAFQGVFVAFLASMSWFWLLSRYRSADIGALILMTPVFGVLLSAWLLDEPLTLIFGIGASLVLLGLILVIRR
ncbi:MAG: DMT family transporter [Moraxella sp.]|nr:DMT family transporter [Moraxella sp.]